MSLDRVIGYIKKILAIADCLLVVVLISLCLMNNMTSSEAYNVLTITFFVNLVLIGTYVLYKIVTRQLKDSLIYQFVDSHIRFKTQIINLAVSKLKKQYKGAALGWAWAVIRPAVTIFVFWFAIVNGLRGSHDVGDCPYFLWLIAGFIPWFYMRDMITGGASCIRDNYYLLKVANFPVITIPTITSISLLVIQMVLIVIMLFIYILFGYPLTIYIVQMPLYIIMMIVFFDFWGLFAGMLSSISKDFLNLVRAFTTVAFWMSGIIYEVNDMHNELLKTILNFSPITIIATGFRHCLVDKTWFFEAPKELLNYFIILIIMMTLANWAYKSVNRILPDVL